MTHEQTPLTRKRCEILEPSTLTEENIVGRIRYHEAGVVWYQQHGEDRLAEWSKTEVERWREKLKALMQRKQLTTMNSEVPTE